MPTAKLDHPLIALVLGFIVLTASVFGVVVLVDQQQQGYRRVAHTLRVENQLTTVLALLEDAETGARGYLLTGGEDYLAPYDNAISRLDADFDILDAMVADDPREVDEARRLRAIADQRETSMRQVLESYRQGDRAGAIATMRQGRGKVLMDQIRAIVTDMKAEEEGLLGRRIAATRQQASLVSAALTLSTLLIIALGVFAFRDGRKRLGEAVTSHVALEAANRELTAEAASRAAAESLVRQMQKMEAVGQLTGGIAHDFNNMLAIIIGSLDVAKRRLAHDLARAETCIDNALEGAQRAAQLTSRLLAFSRQQPLAPRVLDANKLVGGMSEMLRRSVGEQLKVETVLAGGLWPTFADPGQLENAVLNLCVNARDAMPDGGRLTLETGNAHLDDAYASQHAELAPGQYVMVSVSDTGAGMPPEVAERAFDPFYTTKGVGRGTGLGLSQVHGFVKQSGGHVKIYSEPGVGTVVKLYLPRSQSAEQAAGPAAIPAEALRAVGEEIVLVVEDEERVRHLSVDALRDLGYTVVQASDACQALAVLETQPRVDLLFTDIVMPDMNGRRLAEEAAKLRPEIKVLYTTGYTRNAIVHNGMLDADVALLPKPFTFEQLALKVRQVLDGVGANRTA
jgi:signal transduction histidine kinase/ActR/RegA family two-component response regulator